MSNIGDSGDRILTSESLNKKNDIYFASYPNKPFSYLPTPQSPHAFGQYVCDATHSPESPASSAHIHPISTSTPTRQRAPAPKSHLGEARIIIPPPSQQPVTPASSPFVRPSPSSRFSSSIAPQYTPHPSRSMGSPKEDPRTSYNLNHPSPLAPAPVISPSASSPSDGRSSCLSSPFMEKRTIPTRPQSYSPEPLPLCITNISAAPPSVEIPKLTLFSNPLSPSSPPSPPNPIAGGEMERIRQALLQDKLAHFQEAETRRPDYLKRAKRTISEADPAAHEEDDKTRQRDREAAIGIMESPTKGRRLALFQETSEESFEESLMAGGYGRYRTAEWVRQPQPMALATPGPAGPSNVVLALEEAQEVPPTEKELKKRKRLAAFFQPERKEAPIAKLHPVELEGKGRVILDFSGEEEPTATSDSPKKKGGNRRKKKGAESPVKEKKVSPSAYGKEVGADFLERPNWPDAEFPWRVREQERADAASAEEAEKMRAIERFLDRDSDDEGEEEPVQERMSGEEVEERWEPMGITNRPLRMGRGKMVPLPASPYGRSSIKRNRFYPTDPADARAALLSKKSVRTLSYRQQRRQSRGGDDDEILCLCNGRDDGRELVQCDGCETWYHLDCIGIKDIAELGHEEDPWYCRDCDEYGRRSLSPEELELEPSSEPTFVPTDEAPRLSPSYDPPFYQPEVLQDSPMPWATSTMPMPRTPNRRRPRGGGEAGGYGDEYSSDSTWVDSSSRHEPSTPPPHPTQSYGVLTRPTPGPYGSYAAGRYEESPFDPTSTPSRGIKFGTHYATPKHGPWSARGSGLFHTPLRTTGGGRGSWGRASGGYLGSFGCDKVPHPDETPIRRVRSGEGPQPRRQIASPLTSRSLSLLPHSLLGESPVMRFKEAADRRQD